MAPVEAQSPKGRTEQWDKDGQVRTALLSSQPWLVSFALDQAGLELSGLYSYPPLC